MTNNLIPNDPLAMDIIVKVEVNDHHLLADYLRRQSMRQQGSLTLLSVASLSWPMIEMAKEAIFYSNGNPAPQTYGIELMHGKEEYSTISGNVCTLVQRVIIHNQDALRSFAHKRYRERWGHPMEEDMAEEDENSLETCLDEALVSSNCLPSFDTIGLTMLSCDIHDRTTIEHASFPLVASARLLEIVAQPRADVFPLRRLLGGQWNMVSTSWYVIYRAQINALSEEHMTMLNTYPDVLHWSYRHYRKDEKRG